MALQQIQPGSFTFLILREMGVALINGLVWGGIMGAITWWLYDDPQLGGGDDAGHDAQPADGGDDGRDNPDGQW